MHRARLDPQKIAEAAAEIVDCEGRSALTLVRLAHHLCVAPPSLYKHVGGLEDPISRVTTLSIRRLTDELTAAALGRSGREALNAVGWAYRRFAVEHAGLYSLTQAALDPGLRVQQVEADRAVEILRASINGYGIHGDMLIHATRLIRAALHGFADIEARGGFQMPTSVDESLSILIAALDASLSSLGNATPRSSHHAIGGSGLRDHVET